MRKVFLFLGVAGMLLVSGTAMAGINSHEVGAFLVYPVFKAYGPLTTYLTVTNDSGSTPYNVHMALINGEDTNGDGWQDCNECSWDLPLTPYDVDLLQIIEEGDGVAVIKWTQDDKNPVELITWCPFKKGFAVAFVEDADTTTNGHVTLGASVLHGHLTHAWDFNVAWSTSALAIQGNGSNDGDRVFEFNDVEYAAFPDILTVNFANIGPNPILGGDGQIYAALALFNLNYTTFDFAGHPGTSCPANVFDSEETAFNGSFLFKCWTLEELYVPNPWDPNGYFWADCSPGTHGMLFQLAGPEEQSMPTVAWGRALFQSTTRDMDAVLEMVPAP